MNIKQRDNYKQLLKVMKDSLKYNTAKDKLSVKNTIKEIENILNKYV